MDQEAKAGTNLREEASRNHASRVLQLGVEHVQGRRDNHLVPTRKILFATTYQRSPVGPVKTVGARLTQVYRRTAPEQLETDPVPDTTIQWYFKIYLRVRIHRYAPCHGMPRPQLIVHGLSRTISLTCRPLLVPRELPLLVPRESSPAHDRLPSLITAKCGTST